MKIFVKNKDCFSKLLIITILYIYITGSPDVSIFDNHQSLCLRLIWYQAISLVCILCILCKGPQTSKTMVPEEDLLYFVYLLLPNVSWM